MKIYQHNQNTPALDFGLIIKIAVIVTFLMSLVTVSHGSEQYECIIDTDGECVIHMENHFPYDSSIDDVLALCEYWDGEYRPDGDLCVIHTNSYERI